MELNDNNIIIMYTFMTDRYDNIRTKSVYISSQYSLKHRL